MATIIDESDRPLGDDTVKGTEKEKGDTKTVPLIENPHVASGPRPNRCKLRQSQAYDANNSATGRFFTVRTFAGDCAE